MLNRFQPVAAIATNSQTARILQSLCTSDINSTLWIPDTLTDIDHAKYYHSSLAEHLSSIWDSYQAFIFCLATGAVVRLIAPLLRHKSQDPAVIAIDARGNYVISLCGGHQGGADLLAQIVARHIGAIPIITGAAHSLNLPGIDTLGIPYGWQRGTGNWNEVMAVAARQETVQVIQEVGSDLWQKYLPERHSFYFGFSELEADINFQARVWISATKRNFAPDATFPKVQWHPRVLWVGIGCERNTATELIETAIDRTCQQYHLAPEAIAGIASIDLKQDEVGFLNVCQSRNLAFRTFSAEELQQVDVPTPSEIVRQEVGTPSVAEAAAMVAADRNNLLVSKQIYKTEKQGAVTIAIAQAATEYTGRTGKLYLVGIGPGQLAQITPAAKTAITEADVIIGYSLYIDLIEPLQRPGQIIESLPITQEQQRAQRAIELAQWGLTVAVVSSGDCGIYGMAGLVLEELQATGWNGQTPQVQIFPGISALQAAASRVGAPLMHDFCAISLSDLLTPWEIIIQRLEAAAKGDFITAIYNPRSLKRTQQIITAQEIFSQYRPPDTPVAIVRQAYREEEAVVLTTLAKMLKSPIDMLTTVVIGNNSTLNYAGWMITPRGYPVNNN